MNLKSITKIKLKNKMDLDDEWESFLNNDQADIVCNENENNKSQYGIDDPVHTNLDDENIPECSNIKISTKTKIIYLNKTIELADLFWKLKLINYMDRSEGILKKQIKYNFTSKEEINLIEERLKNMKRMLMSKLSVK